MQKITPIVTLQGSRAIILRPIGLVFLIIAAVEFLVVPCIIIYAIIYSAHALKTTGHVVELKEEQIKNGFTVIRPVFEFTDPAGVKHRAASSYAAKPAPYALGAAVEIQYNPQHPEDAHDGGSAVWLCPIIGILVSASGFGIAGYVMVARSRPRREK